MKSALLCAQDGFMGMRCIQRGRHEWRLWLVVGAVREPPEMDSGCARHGIQGVRPIWDSEGAHCCAPNMD